VTAAVDLAPQASGLRVGDVIEAAYLPTYRGDGRVVFVLVHEVGAESFVFVAFQLPDGHVESTTYLAESRIRLTERGPEPAPRTFKVGDRFLLPAGNGKLVRTGTITEEMPDGQWQVAVAPHDTGEGWTIDGFTTWMRSEDLLPADASQADIDAYVKRWQQRAYPDRPRTAWARARRS
jgi:hypothetical protein